MNAIDRFSPAARVAPMDRGFEKKEVKKEGEKKQILAQSTCKTTRGMV
jgi:hypothetical protein